ncbi:hypothetical protein AAG906_013106 [Vitis piasezkii]
MNSIHILTNSPRLTPNGHPRLYPPISSSIRRRNALKKPHHYHPHHNNKPSPDPKLHMVVDLHRLSDRAQILLNRLVSSGADAIDDLRTLVAVDRATQSVVIACRPSTLRFVGVSFVELSGCFGFRVLVRLGLRLRREFGFGSGRGVVVAGPEFGGKEVVVGRAEESEWRMRNHSKVLGVHFRHYQALQFTAGKDSCIVYKWWWEVPPWILQRDHKGGEKPMALKKVGSGGLPIERRLRVLGCEGVECQALVKSSVALESASFAMRRVKLQCLSTKQCKDFFPMLEGKSVKWEGKDRKVWMD